MNEKPGIGLAAFVEEVKRELLTPMSEGTNNVPLLSVDEIELELQVTVSREGKGGIRVYVLELGGGGSRDDVQKVNVKLRPLLTTEERRKLYEATDPDGWQQAIKANLQHLIKGSRGSLQDELVG